MIRSEQISSALRPRRRLAGILLASAFAAAALGAAAFAQAPPAPDFYWPYGLARSGGASVPAGQPVIAFIRGLSCGLDQTKVATAGPPDSDIGKTVYVIEIAADGNGPAQRPGCGRAGDPVLFYLPAQHLTAIQQPTFHQGQERVDLDFENQLRFQARAPQLAGDR